MKPGTLKWRTREETKLPRELLENPESFLQDRTRFIKSSRVVTIAPVPPNLILRRLNYGKFIHRLRDIFRPSRAVRAFIASTWLEQAGIPTPRALAAADVRCCCWPKAAYLITEEIPDARTLAALFAAKQKIPATVPELIARLHNHGLSHRDLKWTNILFDENLSPWLIDLDGVRRLQNVSEARARDDLLSLAQCFAPYPRTLKWTGARFLYRYCALRNPRISFRSLAAPLLSRLHSGA